MPDQPAADVSGLLFAVSPADREKIAHGNAERLLRL